MNILYAMLGGFALDWLFGDPAWLTHPWSSWVNHQRWNGLGARRKRQRGERLGGLTLAIVLPVGTLLLTGGRLPVLGAVHPSLFCGRGCALVRGRRWRRPGSPRRARMSPPAGKGRPARGEKRRSAALSAGHGEADARGRDESGGGDSRRKRERRRDRARFLHDARRRPLALTYKAVNTMDSMVGYKTSNT